MPSKLFTTKDGVKFLITTDVNYNLQKIYNTYIEGVGFHAERMFPSEPNSSYLDFGLYTHTSGGTNWYFKDYQYDTYTADTYDQSLRSILNHLNFYHAMLRWYLIS